MSLVFNCVQFGSFGECRPITAALVSDDGPTDTYSISTLGFTSNLTLPDELWATGGNYELAGEASVKMIDLYLYSGPSRPGHVFGTQLYTGPEFINYGNWGTVPEPGTVALLAAALIVGAAGSGFRLLRDKWHRK